MGSNGSAFSAVSITRSLVLGNVATRSGGVAVFTILASFYVSRSRFASNSASRHGGALMLAPRNLTYTNTAFVVLEVRRKLLKFGIGLISCDLHCAYPAFQLN